MIKGGRVLITAELVVNSTYIELERADNGRKTPAKIVGLDYEANLAIVTPEDPAASSWVADIKPLGTNGPVKIGDSVNIWQLEDNGSALRTAGTVRSVDLLSTFVVGNYFLAYEVTCFALFVSLPAVSSSHWNLTSSHLSSSSSSPSVCRPL